MDRSKSSKDKFADMRNPNTSRNGFADMRNPNICKNYPDRPPTYQEVKKNHDLDNQSDQKNKN